MDVDYVAGTGNVEERVRFGLASGSQRGAQTLISRCALKGIQRYKLILSTLSKTKSQPRSAVDVECPRRARGALISSNLRRVSFFRNPGTFSKASKTRARRVYRVPLWKPFPSAETFFLSTLRRQSQVHAPREIGGPN